MNAYARKEIRLLLPSWAAVLLLETLLPWAYRDADMVFSVAPAAFFLGLAIVAVDAFGREFNLGTFQTLMAQPVERKMVWRTKTTLLLAATGLVSLAYFASCGIRVETAIHTADSVWMANPRIICGDFHDAMVASALLAVVAVAGGLWTSLLLRQATAAFWATLLFPAMVFLLLVLVLPNRFMEHMTKNFALGSACALTGLYGATGYWLARRLFFRAQDVGWSGGTVQFSRWRYFSRNANRGTSRREFRPLAALFKKECQLQSISLFCVGALLALHLCALTVRGFDGGGHSDSILQLFANGFWIFWLAVPAVIGCTAMAEERKLGVVDGQFCLPVARWRAFGIKFVPALALGTLLGGVLPLALEITASHFGLNNDFFKPEAHRGSDFVDGYPLFLLSFVALAAGLVWLGFLASTLTKNFLQALSLTIAGCLLLLTYVIWLGSGTTPKTPLPYLIALPVIPATMLWLAWRNFNYFAEGWRLWRRNLLGIACAMVFVVASSAAVYNRVWEFFGPAEPPHGAARLHPPDAPALVAQAGQEIYLQWPDGRVWCDSLGYPDYENYRSKWQYLAAILCRPRPGSDGPRQFAAGSNWVALTTRRINFLLPENGRAAHVEGYWDTVGIKRDGTLWISSEDKPFAWTGAEMKQVGTNRDWQQVARWQNGFLLLKTNGTLWSWSRGTNRIDWAAWQTNWPTVRDHSPIRAGTNSDWREMFCPARCQPHARKEDGSTWWFEPTATNGPVAQRAEYLDEVTPKTFSNWGNGPMAYVSPDGVLHFYQERWKDGQKPESGFRAIGTGTNWQSVAVGEEWMVALKKDGTLWKWDISQASLDANGLPAPARLGIHDDWIGIGSTWAGIISLAADGSLWVWPSADNYDFALMRPPKQPHPIGNILAPEN